MGLKEDHIMEDLRLRFSSMNSVDIPSILLSRNQYDKIVAYTEELKTEIAQLQRSLDDWREEASKAHHHDESSEAHYGYR